MDRILQRRDTAANWSTTNPILAEGEIGIITDGAKGYKIGDGVTRWNALEYPANPTSVVQDIGIDENVVISQNASGVLFGKAKIIDSFPSLRKKLIATSNVGTIQNQVLTLLPNTSLTEGSYYGIVAGINAQAGNKLYTELHTNTLFENDPVWTNGAGLPLTIVDKYKYSDDTGIIYVTVFDITSSDIGIVLQLINTVDTTKNYIISFGEVGIYNDNTIRKVIGDIDNTVEDLYELVNDNSIVEIITANYRDSLVATSNQTAALNEEVLTIPVNAGWGAGSYYGYITNLDDLFGKQITIQLLSSIKLTKIPVWVNGGTSISNITTKEEVVENGWLYTNVLDLTATNSGNVILQPATVLNYTKEAVWSIPFTGIKETLPMKEAVEDLYSKNDQVHYTVITANSDESSNADFKGNLAIQQAFESITDASETNQYIIKATGNFLITSPNDYLNIPALGAWVYIRHKDYVHLDGIDKENCIIRCELSQNLSEVQSEKPSFVKSNYGDYQPAFWNSKANISNVTFVVRNIRYPLHVDGGTNGCKNYIQLIENCRLIHEGKYGDSIGTVGGSASGFGMSSGQKLTLKNCYLEGSDGWAYVHDNKNFTDSSELTFDSCKFLNNIAYSLELNIQGLNSLVSSRITFRNCTLPEWGRIEYTSSVTETSKLRADTLNYICDMQDIEPISVRVPSSATKCIRIVSKSTNSNSSVRFDPDSTAFSIIGFKNETSLVSRNRYNRSEQYGYQYRDGGNGLAGEAIGFANVMETVISGKYLTSLGKRLGDCSNINKTLTIIVDGISYNVVFNKNYNGTSESSLPNYTNQQIISEINAVIGSVATVEEYDINQEWFPMYKGVQLFKVNSITYIEKGMGVVFTDNMNVRKATASDTFIDGIALDNGANGTFIRVMQSGKITSSSDFHYSLNKGEEFSDSSNLLVGIVSDGKFGPSAVNKTMRCLSRAYGKLK